MIEVNKSNFDTEVLKSDKKVLVDFNAEWCGPCKMMKPVLENLSETTDDIKIVSVNIDNNEDLAQEYNISSMPCLVLFKNGIEVNRSIGLKSIDEIETFIRGE